MQWANLGLHANELQLFLSSPVHLPSGQETTHTSLNLDSGLLLCQHLHRPQYTCPETPAAERSSTVASEVRVGDSGLMTPCSEQLTAELVGQARLNTITAQWDTAKTTVSLPAPQLQVETGNPTQQQCVISTQITSSTQIVKQITSRNVVISGQNNSLHIAVPMQCLSHLLHDHQACLGLNLHNMERSVPHQSGLACPPAGVAA